MHPTKLRVILTAKRSLPACCSSSASSFVNTTDDDREQQIPTVALRLQQLTTRAVK